MDRISALLNTVLAFCHTLEIRVRHLYHRIVRNDIEQATMNQGLIDSLAGAHEKIRDLETKQAICEQRLALLEGSAGAIVEGDKEVKEKVKKEPQKQAYGLEQLHDAPRTITTIQRPTADKTQDLHGREAENSHASL